MRVGIGYAFRPFQAGRPLILAGVAVPGGPEVAGADVADPLSCAVADALLGAAGLEGPGGAGAVDLPGPGGTEEARSGGGDLLEESVRRLERENYQVVNVDVRLLAAGLPTAASALPLAERLAEKLHVSPAAVSIREGRCGEGAGEGAGLTVLAVALVDQIADLDALHASLR